MGEPDAGVRHPEGEPQPSGERRAEDRPEVIGAVAFCETQTQPGGGGTRF